MTSKITNIIITRINDKQSRHYTHKGAAKALLKSDGAIRNIFVRQSNGEHYALNSVTINEEILPRIRDRKLSSLVEVLEILSV